MLKILIAEDEEPIANLIKMNLDRAGYECLWTSNGEEAADLMTNEHFDLVLLDIMLPKINGYELMEYAKELGVPVKFVGLGEGIGDLQPFDAREYVNAII